MGNRQGTALPGTALDPDTRSQAKNYFKLIQAVLNKTSSTGPSTAPSPKSVNKQVQGLTAFIRLSSSTEQFKANNTKQWMQNNVTLLQDHHVNVVTCHSTMEEN